MHELTVLASQPAEMTMSSLEIAKLTGKEHKNVLADIRTMLEELEIEELSFQRFYLGGCRQIWGHLSGGGELSFQRTYLDVQLVPSGRSSIEQIAKRIKAGKICLRIFSSFILDTLIYLLSLIFCPGWDITKPRF